METVPLNSKLRYMASDFDTHFKVFHELMSNKVLEILLVASAYDAYILEEDGSLASKIINEYHGLNLSRPPRITRVDGAQQALALIHDHPFDLVITMPRLDDMDSYELGLAIKALNPGLPVILLAHTIQGLYPPPSGRDTAGIDQVFIWSGDADLLLAIVKSVEDRLNVEKDTLMAQVRVIILVEDSPLYRSYFLPRMYKEVVHQTQEVLDESLNEEHRLLKMRARPKILVADTYESALELVERYRPYLFGVVSDTRFPCDGELSADAGVRFLSRIKKETPDLPLLLISNESDNRLKAEEIKVQFLDKNSPNLFDELHHYFLDFLGFGDFVFRYPDGTEAARASNLRELEKVLATIPEEPLCYHASRNRFSNWIMARSEIVLASQLRLVQISDFPDVESVRQYLVGSIHGLRKWRQKGVVGQFNAREFDSQIADIVKIGRGSLGGKARGLAFVANLLRQSPKLFDNFKGIDIRIPASLVITTEVFDAFIADNNLRLSDFVDQPDQRIAEAFAAAQLPQPVEKDLAAYLAAVHYPISVRSSSLLEDAHHQPLAGLYKTFMLPNSHPDDGIRLERLISAIKQVFASTWFEEPRRFARSTVYRHRKEQMAVMIQQIAGRRYGDDFFPVISGRAGSLNYYPIDRIRPDDGMAIIAMGFGKVMGKGGGGLRFCPKYPATLPDFSKIEDILANAQRSFYILPQSVGAGFDLKADLQRRDVAEALEHPSLASLVSTYLPQDGRIRDAIIPGGIRLITFAPILKHKAFPLADLIASLLALGRSEMGCHVEFEFSVDLAGDNGEPPEFCILQMRPMSISADPFAVEWTPADKAAAIGFASHAMGHGEFGPLSDIVYLKPDCFDTSATREMAMEISKLNSKLKSRQRPYLLIGPGRWGSFDPWLGIPVKWDDISAAAAIVELRNADLKADPSQGSHFFQHITNNGLPYLTITEESEDYIRWDEILACPVAEDHRFVAHARPSIPLVIKCDGRSSQAIILFTPTDSTDAHHIDSSVE
jgi:CheY-like chemotaxis protein